MSLSAFYSTCKFPKHDEKSVSRNRTAGAAPVVRSTRKPPTGALAKPERRKTTKGRKDRAEDKVAKVVRALCVKRDGSCRIWKQILGMAEQDKIGWCEGISEWAHMHQKRRSQTRGQAPETRHTTTDSLMLCRVHHDQYDGRAKPRLRITCLSRKGADGPLKFTRAKCSD